MDYHYLVVPRGVKFATRHEAVGYRAVSSNRDPNHVELDIVAVEVNEEGEIAEVVGDLSDEEFRGVLRWDAGV